MATREQNERRFKNWEDFANGGRRYWYDVQGRRGFLARYVKVVDAAETTLEFYQEIYNADGKLVSFHRKYPEDLGHQDAEA